jgi:hypothetical protein
MVILFFYFKGIILQHWLPQKQTMNGDYYANRLKTHLRNAIWGGETRILDKMVVSASRQCMAAYSTYDDTGTSTRWWNTNTTATLQSTSHPRRFFFWHFQHLNMSYKARNFAMTLK